MKRFPIYFLILLFAWNSPMAQQEEKPLDHWFTIKNKRIVPVASLRNHTLVYLNLTDYDSNDTVKICHDTPIDLWVNNQLFHRQLPEGCDRFTMEELTTLAGMDSVILSVAYEKYANLEASLISGSQINDSLAQAERSRSKLSEFYLMALIIILIMIAFLKYLFPNKYAWLLSNPLSSRSALDMDELYTGFWHLENLFTSLIFSLFISLQVIYLNQDLNIWLYLNTWNEQFFLQWLFVTGLIFLALLAKYIFSWLMSRLLQARILPNVQFQDFVQIFIWLSFACVGLFFIDLYLIAKPEYVLTDLAYLLIIGVLLAFQVWLYFKFVKFYSHKKLLIISYLCTTEILPVFLIIFWLVK